MLNESRWVFAGIGYIRREEMRDDGSWISTRLTQNVAVVEYRQTDDACSRHPEMSSFHALSRARIRVVVIKGCLNGQAQQGDKTRGSACKADGSSYTE